MGVFPIFLLPHEMRKHATLYPLNPSQLVGTLQGIPLLSDMFWEHVCVCVFFLKFNFVTGPLRGTLLCASEGIQYHLIKLLLQTRENIACEHKITPSTNRAPFKASTARI